MIRSITPVFSIIIATLLFFFVIQPKYNEIKTIRNETDEYKSATEQYAAFNATIQNLLLKRDSVKVEDRNRLNMLVPEELNDTRVLVDIEKIALDNNALIIEVETANDDIDVSSLVSEKMESTVAGVEQSNDELVTSDITVTLMAQYHDFKNFLREIETSLTIMHVTNITFTESEGDYKKFSVTVRTYALPESHN